VKPMDSRSIDSELLDRMTEVELHVKYQCFSPALELLRGIIAGHPDYLPAKEALRELYRRRGDSAKAQEIDREIALLRERLADKSLQNDSRRGSAEQSEKRKLTEKIEAIVKEIYETNELVEIQTTATSRLVESLHADRCVIIRLGSGQEKTNGFEHCREGVSASLNAATLELNRLILRTMSAGRPQPLVSDDTLKDPRLLGCRDILRQFDIRSLLAVPLLYKSCLTGLIVVHRCNSPIQWSEQAKTIFSTVAGHLGVALRNAELFSAVQTRAITDQLTGVYNRGFFEDRLSAELSQPQRYPLCLALLDIDHFKGINDTYGHAVGDTVLRKLGFLLKTNVRKGSVVARFGGEEFAVIFPNVSLQTAHLAIDNIRRLIESNIVTDDGKPVTISAGVSEADLSDPAGLNRAQQLLIQKADENLYQAKRSGRNRVCSLSENSCQMRIAFPEYPPRLRNPLVTVG
jgi:diguanylate cyclase (GGDEF)-like protein